jgi:hypothetical protein
MRRKRRLRHAERQGWKTRNSVITGASVSAGAALGLAAPAFGAAQAFYVGTLADDGTVAADCTDNTNIDCTLRQAITDANANAGQYDYVVFKSGLSGTIHLGMGSGSIPITDATYIDGGNEGGFIQAVISGDHQTRIFDIDTPHPGDVVSIYRLRLEDGSVVGNGGAIHNQDASLRVYDSAITDSHASGNGGAIYSYLGNLYEAGTDVWYSTVSGNSADGDGGGIAGHGGFGSVYLSTFAGNSASKGGAASSEPGVFDYLSAVASSTISGNTATGSSGGLYAKRLSVISSIVANNSGSSAAEIRASDYLRLDYSLVKAPPTSITAGHHNILGVDPQLGPLSQGEEGALTPILKPARESPVVDQGNSYNYADQRGSYRPVDNPYVANVPGGDGTDIGSVELSPAEGPRATPPPSPPVTPTPAPQKKCKKKKHKRSAQSAKKKKCKKKKKKTRSVAGSSNRDLTPRAHAPMRWRHAGEQLPFRLGG